jgi:hypothetical protein
MADAVDELEREGGVVVVVDGADDFFRVPGRAHLIASVRALPPTTAEYCARVLAAWVEEGDRSRPVGRTRA